MRKTIKTLILAMLFCFMLAPTVKAEAASYVKQTDATADSVTITWDTPYSNYAESYVVYVGNSPYQQVSKTTKTLKITGLKQGVAYPVSVLFVNNEELWYLDKANNSSLYVRTKPAKLSITDIVWDKSDKIEFAYIDDSLYRYFTSDVVYKYIDGIEFRAKDVKGKVKKTIKKTPRKTVSYSSDAEEWIDSFTFKAPSSIKNKGMQYQVRTYILLDNGKKVYSDWTSTKVIVPQAKISKLQKVSTNKIRVTWKKVSGAKNYTIYKTTNSGKSYKKVKTVSSKTTSYTVSGFKKGKKNGVVVVANKVKVGKKRYNSTKSYYTYYKK